MEVGTGGAQNLTNPKLKDIFQIYLYFIHYFLSLHYSSNKLLFNYLSKEFIIQLYFFINWDQQIYFGLMNNYFHSKYIYNSMMTTNKL